MRIAIFVSFIMLIVAFAAALPLSAPAEAGSPYSGSSAHHNGYGF